MNIKHRFNTNMKMAAPDWLQGFLSCHFMSSICKPQPINIARAVDFNRKQVEHFF